MQNREGYSFVCFCDVCRKVGWRAFTSGDQVPPSLEETFHSLPDDQKLVPRNQAPLYHAYGTIMHGKGSHFAQSERRRQRGSAQPADPYEQMFRTLAKDPRFFAHTFGGVAFAIPRVVDERAKRRRDEDDEDQSDSGDEDQTAMDVSGQCGGGEAGCVDQDVENGYVEEAEPERFPGEETAGAREGRVETDSREETLDGVSSMEQILGMHASLADLNRFFPHQAENSVLAAQFMLEKGVPLEVINGVTKIVTKTPAAPGFTLDSLMQKWKMPYTESWSCKEGHDVHTDSGSTCDTCCQQRCVRSLKVDFELAVKHLARQPEIADNIMHGPLIQKRYLEKLAAERQAVEGGDAEAAPVQADPHVSVRRVFDEAMRRDRSLNDEATVSERRMDCTLGENSWGAAMESVWQSQAMYVLREKIHWKAGDYGRVPLPFQLFVDAFQPFKGGYSMLLVTMKVLNPPTSIANDFLLPLAVIDGKQKPSKIDAILNNIVEQLKAYVPEPGSQASPECLVARLGCSSGPVANLCPILFQVCVDSRAMQQVSHHREHPSKEPCNKCTMQGRMLKHPTKNHSQRIYDTVHANGTLNGRKTWAKDSNTARLRMESAGRIARECPELVPLLDTYTGCSPFHGLWYFDVVWGFPVCAMHQIMNVAKRSICQVLGSSSSKTVGWEPDAQRQFWESTEGRQLLRNSGIDPHLFQEPVPPACMNPYPHASTKPMPPEARNLKQALRAATSTTHPTNYHGYSKHIMTLASHGKASDYFRWIKAAEGKDHTMSGTLAIMMKYGGVHEVVVKAYADLFYAIKKLCAHVVDWEEIFELYDGGMQTILANLQKVLPPTEQTSALHALIHLPEQVLRFGPMPDTWSFPFEGLFSKLKPMANLNKAVPAQTVASRSGLLMAFRDLTRELRASNSIPVKDIMLDSPVRMSDRNLHELKLRLQGLLLSKPLPTDMRSQIEACNFDVVEYRKLTIHKSVELQGRHSKRRTRDNSLLLVKNETPIPTLGRVHQILRVSIRGINPDEVRHRVYALVKGYALWGGPENHHEVYVAASNASMVERLVSLDEVVDQCFLGGDPDHPERCDNQEDLIMAEPTGYLQHFVYTKGRLRNVQIGADADFYCPDL